MGIFSSSRTCVLAQVKSRLQTVSFLDTTAPYLAIMNVKKAQQKGTKIVISLETNIPCLHRTAPIENQLLTLLKDELDVESVKLDLEFVAKRANNSQTAPQVKQIVLVASGKGGVGKSTTAANIALALTHGGASVGLLDADIYGPSVPMMFSAQGEKPVSHDGKLLKPVTKYGVETMSIGYLVPDEDATVWRGPMASRALGQLLNETAWGPLDYLIVDMPPGTGDIQLTMSGDMPVSGAVVVTTPQNLALNDAQKGISMFNKVNVPVLGVIENMSYHQCSACGHKDSLFGQDGGNELAGNNAVPLLGKLPLVAQISKDIEAGQPTLLSPDSPLSELYLTIAQSLTIKLNQTNQAIPSIVTGE